MIEKKITLARPEFETASPVWSCTFGFSAIELLITMVLVGILTSLAVPALRSLVLNNRAVSRIN